VGKLPDITNFFEGHVGFGIRAATGQDETYQYDSQTFFHKYGFK